jgi:Chaperone of endosialidase
MFDFPDAPAVGDTYPNPPVAGTPVYTWDGEKWDVTETADMSGYLPLGGGTLTGPLIGTTVTLSGKGTAIAWDINGAAATWRQVRGLSAGVARWTISLGDTTAEGGANAGSDFAIHNYADDGTTLQRAMYINRKTGNASFAGISAINFVNISASATSQAEVLQFYNSAGSRAGWIGQYPANANSMVFACDLTSANITLQTDASLSTPTATAYKVGGGPWAASSDARIKDVVDEYHGGLEAILGLTPVVYTYKGNDGDPAAAERGLKSGAELEAGREFVGLVAQDVEPVMPEMVRKVAGFIDGIAVDDFRTLDTGPLIFALVNAVKTLAARVAALEEAAAAP